jgi:uncharacterized protein (UPF0210 family)
MNATVRTITVAIGDRHPLGEDAIDRAAIFLRGAQAHVQASGYSVQTIRVATRPLLADMVAAGDLQIDEYAQQLQVYCEGRGLAYCSIGPAPAASSTFAVDRIRLIPRLLASSSALHGTVQLATSKAAPRYEAALATALAMRELADRGGPDANFRFAALACAEPGGPFFPQAFAAKGPWTVTVGLQSAGVVRQAIEEVAVRAGVVPPRLDEIRQAVTTALETHARPIVELVRDLASDAGLAFGGIDLSPAPMGEESIADAIEAAKLGRFGAPGTLAVATALTSGIQGTALPTCGYSGLMLPVLEDRTIGLRCADESINIQMLLTYSVVCGTGLDTVPIPGGTPPERVAALLLDVATLARRLRKPLSARLFLVPGGAPGDMTAFVSPYLTNTRILPVG